MTVAELRVVLETLETKGCGHMPVELLGEGDVYGIVVGEDDVVRLDDTAEPYCLYLPGEEPVAA